MKGLRAAIHRIVQSAIAGRTIEPFVSQELIGRIDGAVRDALLDEGCPHHCVERDCPYYRRLRGED